jgi:hydrogenase/urease accessory protein HupE
MSMSQPRHLPPLLGDAASLRWAAVRAGLLALILVGSLWPSIARAHSPTFAVYSKYEGTTSGRSIAFVFALDRAALLSLLERDAAHHQVELAEISQYGAFFSRYLFDRFSVSNGGAVCQHPDALGRFFWDDATNRVVAVTKFVCATELGDVRIRSLVTHDMPIPHELVGDLQHGGALVRHFFRGDDVEAHIEFASLPASGVVEPPLHMRNRFAYVTVPDETRRYDGLLQAELGAELPRERPALVHPGATIGHFLGEGVRHIFTGYDHILFIVTLILSVTCWRQLAITVSAFTAAHSVTLALATLGLVTVPARLVEPLIAASVLFVALDAVLRPNASTRAHIAFAFGLIHGFGLSNVLRDLGLSGRELLPALLGFNLGVEVGQLLIVAPLFALLLMMRKDGKAYARLRDAVAGGVALVAVLWIVLRLREALVG